MSIAPSLGVPELAGIASYPDAARIGFSVEDNVGRLVRLHWVERRLHDTMILRLTVTPEWEVKCGLALHQWQDIDHADALRRRIMEMRSPAPSLDSPPDSSLDAFLDEVLRGEDTLELLAGIYRVAKRALAAAYRRHLALTNPLVDHPTRRMMRPVLLEEEEAVSWGEAAVEALVARDPAASERVAAWESHLRAYLGAAGGIAGDETRDGAAPALPPPRAASPFVPDFTPRRDERFDGQYNFNFPPHLIYNAEGVPAAERNLALLCKRTLEMDVPEMMASILGERRDQPWEFHLDFARQLWDEARHAMMGTVAFEDRGVDWTRIPLNVGFSLRLNRHATALERQLMLFAIEQSLMPGETGKRYEYRTAVAARDPLSAHFHDYDWADEVLHAQIGRRWIAREGNGIPVDEAKRRAQAVHERTWAALDRYKEREPQAEWWRDFVREVLGTESRVTPESLGELKIIAE
jgi:bacterioferritin (cytochrome b1)